jgi:archaellum component FlaG (FlaF/FlaG flagellin family)
MMTAPIIIFVVYLVLIVFSIWLAYTLVMAVVRISRAMENASSSLAEIARNQAGRSNPPS